MPSCTTTHAQDALVRGQFPHGDHPFTICGMLDEEQKATARAWIDRGAAEGLVDEEAGGIIAYIDRQRIDRITALLNAAAAQAKAEQTDTDHSRTVMAMRAALRCVHPHLVEYCDWHEKRGGCSMEMLEARDQVAAALAGAEEVPRHDQADPWRDDQTQFARLLGEMCQLGIIPKGKAMRTLCESMDLQPQDVRDLFDRASDAWDRRKAETQAAGGTTPARVSPQDRQQALRACIDDLCDGDHGQAERRLVGEWVRDLIRDNPEDGCSGGLLLASLDELMAAIAAVRASVAAPAQAA